MNSEQWKTIRKEINNSNQTAFKQGMTEGLYVADRILQLFETNHQLVKPHSQEQLSEWSRQFIDEATKKTYPVSE